MLIKDKEILKGLKEEVLNRNADIIIIQKGNTRKHLILVSKNSLKWEIFNGSCEHGLSKAFEILSIDDRDIISGSTTVNYSVFTI